MQRYKTWTPWLQVGAAHPSGHTEAHNDGVLHGPLGTCVPLAAKNITTQASGVLPHATRLQPHNPR